MKNVIQALLKKNLVKIKRPSYHRSLAAILQREKNHGIDMTFQNIDTNIQYVIKRVEFKSPPFNVRVYDASNKEIVKELQYGSRWKKITPSTPSITSLNKKSIKNDENNAKIENAII